MSWNEWILTGSGGTCKSLQCNTIREWSGALNLTDLYISDSGERVSPSSKATKGRLEDEFHGFGSWGCKVDLQWYYMGHEIAIFEFKTSGTGDLKVKRQYLKTICLNRAVMEENFKWSRIRPTILFMSIEGMCMHK